MDLATVLSRVKLQAGSMARRKLDVTLAPNDDDDPQLTIYANNGAVELAKGTGRATSKGSVAVVAATYAYTVGNSVDSIGRMTLDTGGATIELDHTSGEIVRLKCEDLGAASGTPTRAGLYADKIYLYPIPDAAGTLYVYYLAASFVGEGDAWASEELPVGDLLAFFPPELEMPLVDFVLGNWLRGIGEEVLAAPFLNRFEAKMREYRQIPRAPKRMRQAYKPL